MPVVASSSWVLVWINAARPRTLPAAIAPVLLASALAWRDGLLKPAAALGCLVFAVLIQIGTNFANDYYDFMRGADTAERVGPQRAVASGLIAPATMKHAMIGVFTAAFLAGLMLLGYGGWPLLFIGVASIVCGIVYTGGPYPLGYNGLGDLFVFIFFGLVAVGATYFVQTGLVTGEALVIGVGVGALATNILVVNNYRDLETDTKAGKRTLVVRFGRPFARIQFAFCHLMAVGTLLAIGLHNHWQPMVIVVTIGVALGVGFRQTRRLTQAKTPVELVQLLGATGLYMAVYAMMFSLGLIWG